MQLLGARRMRLRRVLVTAILGALWIGSSGPAGAEVGSLFPRATGTATPLFEATGGTGIVASGQTRRPFSTRKHSFLAPLPDRSEGIYQARMSPREAGPLPATTAELLTLIALAEAGPAGYDAVQHGATVKPNFPPTHMTLGEIYAWIEETPRQPHAIGRYQFIPKTLRRVARIRGYGPDTFFSPDVQDSLALVLLEEAGLSEFRNGTLDKTKFMHNLARIWAGLPLPTGKSYYEGYAGNKATMSWPTFWRGMQRIFS